MIIEDEQEYQLFKVEDSNKENIVQQNPFGNERQIESIEYENAINKIINNLVSLNNRSSKFLDECRKSDTVLSDEIKKNLEKFEKELEENNPAFVDDEILKNCKPYSNKQYIKLLNIILEIIADLEYQLIKKTLKEFTEEKERTKTMIDKFTEEKLETKTMIENVNKEAKDVKKELVTIMGLFIGLFSFIQLNFSQLGSLKDFSPLDKVFFLFIFNIIFLVGIFMIMMVLEIFVNGGSKLFRSVYNKEKNRLEKFGGIVLSCTMIIIILFSYLLHNSPNKKLINTEENIAKNKKTIEKNTRSVYESHLVLLNEIDKIKNKIIYLENFKNILEEEKKKSDEEKNRISEQKKQN